MTDDQNDIVLIDRFLSHDLNADELVSFNKKLEDPAFKKLFTDEKTIRKGIAYSTLKNLSAELRALEATLPEVELNGGAKERIVSFWNNTAFKIAASVLVLIAGAYLIYQFTNQPVDLNLAFERNFSPYPNEFYIPKRGDDNLQDSKSLAFALYDAKEYKQALAQFEQIPENERNDVISFYKANTYLAVGQFIEANKELRLLAEKREGVLYDQSVWYLSLSYIKLNNIEEAKKYLAILKDSNSSYRESASKLLDKISSQ